MREVFAGIVATVAAAAWTNSRKLVPPYHKILDPS
jgi:hypothetical protein